MKKTVYLSLGANLGDRSGNLREAVDRLRLLGTITSQSAPYETEPVDVEGQQPWFLNCVVAIETEYAPREFLENALAVERAMGRLRSERKGPRPVDIDIIFFGDEVIQMPGLTVPHPAMHQRRFVLEPLAEIAPDVRHPVLKRSVKELLADLPKDSGAVRRLE